MFIVKNLIFLFLSYIILTTYAFSNSVSEYISNLIPGEGDTEVSIDLRENHSPDYSILLVREIDRNENSNYFTQMSLFNTEKNNDERITANFGLGKRFLSDDKFSLTGLNLFLDYFNLKNIKDLPGIEDLKNSGLLDKNKVIFNDQFVDKN